MGTAVRNCNAFQKSTGTIYFHTVRFNFGPPYPQVISGERYWIVIDSTAADKQSTRSIGYSSTYCVDESDWSYYKDVADGDDWDLSFTQQIVYRVYGPTPGAKWIQLPDEGDDPSEGIAVISSMVVDGPLPIGVVLADDFQCTETGPITDICVWGSWMDDVVYEDAVFQVFIWSGIPFMSDPWVDFFEPGDYTVVPWNLNYDGYFYDPCWGYDEDASIMYQYHFHITEEDAFEQEQGEVYWLTVVEVEGMEHCYWGWNIARYEDRWENDAVCLCFEGDDFFELDYPYWHYYDDESMDLAFVINCPSSPEPTPTKPPTPGGETVGIDVFTVDKTGLIAPWIALGAIVIGGIFLVRRKSHSNK